MKGFRIALRSTPQQPYRRKRTMTITTSEAVSAYIEWGRQARDWSKSNVKSTRSRLSSFANAHSTTPVSNLRSTHFSAHFASLSDRLDSSTSFNGYRRTYIRFVRWLRDQQFITTNLMADVHAQSVDERDIEIMSMVEFRQCCSTVASMLESDEPQDVRDAAIWLLTADAAIRPNELFSFSYNDLLAALQRSYETARGPVYALKVSNSRADREIMFTSITAQAIERWIEIRPNPGEIDLPDSYYVASEKLGQGRVEALERARSAVWLSLARSSRHYPLSKLSRISSVFLRIAQEAKIEHGTNTHLRMLVQQFFERTHGIQYAQHKVGSNLVRFQLGDELDRDDLIEASARSLLSTVPEIFTQ